jgi:hypothetical protein
VFRRLGALVSSVILAIGMFAAPAAALDFTCNRLTDGQVRIRLFDYYDKNTAIWTQCALPDDGFTYREDFILQGYANNQAKSAVARTSSTIDGGRYIIIRYYDGLFTGQLEFQVLPPGAEHWFNFTSAESNRVSSIRIEYY